MTLRRPTLQLRCLAGLLVLAAAPDLDKGGLADCISDLPGRVLLEALMEALAPTVVRRVTH